MTIFITGNYEPLTYHNCIWNIVIDVKKEIKEKKSGHTEIKNLHLQHLMICIWHCEWTKKVIL